MYDLVYNFVWSVELASYLLYFRWSDAEFLAIPVLIGVGAFFFCHLAKLRKFATSACRQVFEFPLRIVRIIKNSREPVGWIGAFASTLALLISYGAYSRDTENLDLALTCTSTTDAVVGGNYVHILANCKVKNVGNVTSTIDSISPTFYYSNPLRLNRGAEQENPYIYTGNDYRHDDPTFLLPQTLHPGETRFFQTSVKIAVTAPPDTIQDLGMAYDRTGSVDLDEFAECLKTSPLDACMELATGKILENYVYEAFHLSYPIPEFRQVSNSTPINGVGVIVRDFNYTVQTEVDLFSANGFSQRSEVVGNLIRLRFKQFQEDHHGRPWWNSTMPVLLELGENGEIYLWSRPIWAAGKLIVILITVFGWKEIVVRLSLRIYNFGRSLL